MKTSKNITLILVVFTLFISIDKNSFAQTNFSNELESKFSASQVETIAICDRLFIQAERKLKKVSEIENEYTKLKDSENSKKWETKIWEAKGKRIDAYQCSFKQLHLYALT